MTFWKFEECSVDQKHGIKLKTNRNVTKDVKSQRKIKNLRGGMYFDSEATLANDSPNVSKQTVL